MQLSGNRRNALSGAEEEDGGFQSQSELCENKSDGAQSGILD